MSEDAALLSPLHALTATQIQRRLAAGDMALDAVANACRARIATRDPDVRAWLHVAPDRLMSAPSPGPLQGVPIAIKDMIDTGDMPTTHNSPLYEGHRPSVDAACVETLRAAGAVILGKTDTTEFAAAGRNAATGNPHNLDHTPGGSSAGSAAAVADFQVPLALATQTGGSTIRPGSFCGVHAFKPTWGRVSREGVKIYANSLDTVGWYAREIRDLELLCEVFAIGAGEAAAPPPPSGVLRIAICRSPAWPWAEKATRDALAASASAFAAGGATVVELELPSIFEGLAQAHKTILHREGGVAFLNLQRGRHEGLHDDFRHRVENRHGFTDRDLRDAYDAAALARIAFDALAEDFDAVLTPSAPGVAPVGRGPGDPVFNQMWTLLHTPCVNLPNFRGEMGLPVGLTLTGPRFSDRALLRTAKRLDALLTAAGHGATCARFP